jgi:hypothetical protein
LPGILETGQVADLCQQNRCGDDVHTPHHLHGLRHAPQRPLRHQFDDRGLQSFKTLLGLACGDHRLFKGDALSMGTEVSAEVGV